MEEEGLLCTPPEIRELAEQQPKVYYQINPKRRTKNNSRNLKIGVRKIICKRFLNSYLYIKAAKWYFDETREKLSPRPLAAEAKTISRTSKDFVAKVYTTFCVQPKICNYKMNT
jgi:hypothetical protein